MKGFMKKAVSVLLAALLLIGVNASVASAEASPVIIHAKDGENWGVVNVYNWGDGGETAGVWPGTAMTAEEDGWYTFTIETEVDLNLVFNATGGSPQSANVDPIAPDAGEVWVVIGGEGEANPLSGGGTAAVTLYLEAEEGFPLAAAEEPAAEAVAEAEVPKTGESIALILIFIGLAALSAVAYVALKKKEQRSEI